MIQEHINSHIVSPKYPVDQRRISSFLSNKSKNKRYVIGRNDVSKELTKNLPVKAIVDDFYNEKEWQGIPVINSADINSDSYILNCSSSISPITVNNIFSRKGHEVIGYHEINYLEPGDFKLPEFVSQSRMDFKNNKEKWNNLFSNFSDEESKKTLLDLLNYRLSGDFNYLEGYSIQTKDQYFETFMEYHHEYFVDAGGFDGDTTEEFINRYPDFSHVYFFEPSDINMRAAKKRLGNKLDPEKIDFIPFGLSNTTGEISFNTELGSSSHITNTGKQKINVTTLDEYINNNISFIKMDLEGWELNALNGAKDHISLNHPKLAIAVYHEPSHFWQVFEYINKISKHYDVYLRHYTEGWSETIMYFKPKTS